MDYYRPLPVPSRTEVSSPYLSRSNLSSCAQLTSPGVIGWPLELAYKLVQKYLLCTCQFSKNHTIPQTIVSWRLRKCFRGSRSVHYLYVDISTLYTLSILLFGPTYVGLVYHSCTYQATPIVCRGTSYWYLYLRFLFFPLVLLKYYLSLRRFQ